MDTLACCVRVHCTCRCNTDDCKNPLLAPFPQKDEVYLNLVLDYVPETVYRVARHYSRAKQTLPMVYVKVRRRRASWDQRLTRWRL